MNNLNLHGRRLAGSLLLASTILIGLNANAATPEPPGLFTTLPGKSQAVLPEQAIDGRSRAVKINKGRLRSGRFFVGLPDGVSFEAVRDTQYELGNGRSAWVGHAKGRPGDRVVIGISGDDQLCRVQQHAD